MLNLATLEKLRGMRLAAMADALVSQQGSPQVHELSFDERLGLLVDQQWTAGRDRRLARLLKEAKLRLAASPEDIDYRTPRGLDKALIRSLLSGDWLRDGRNILLTGPTGVGKTFLACALGNAACRQAYRTLYYRLPRLLGDLEPARADGSCSSLLGRLTRAELLILDDWGLSPPHGLGSPRPPRGRRPSVWSPTFGTRSRVILRLFPSQPSQPAATGSCGWTRPSW